MNTPGIDLDEDIDRRAVPALKWHPIVLGTDGEGLFPAGVADMDFRAPPAVLAAMQHRLDHGVFGYETVPEGLILALVGWLQERHDWQVEPTYILRAPNVLNILAMAVSLFTEPGDGVIVQPPVFFDFYDILRENQRHQISNPLILRNGHYTMDFAGLERLASKPGTRMIYLCNPHNPIGRVWSKEELQTLGDICARHDVLVVSDEIHGDITFPGHAYTPFAALGLAYADNAITCLSPAKSFNIAACCSAFTVVSNDALRKVFQAENSRLTVNKNNAFASVAMEAAYSQGSVWLDQVLAYLHGNLALVRDHLGVTPGVQLIEPEGTFLLWIDFRGLGLPPDGLTGFLRRHAGWAVTHGQAFGVEGKGFARLNIACPRARLEKALKQLTLAVSERLNHPSKKGEPQ
jgi:cysteine-S-conjugate beta-lyase